ncbi:metal-dependent hydrolase [Brevibacillus borstelensis]|uniref:metal-dependent hydrolase n=1 Tax=Brevibacillus borstelensis TaxID=45462 RepID=UPI0030C40F60
MDTGSHLLLGVTLGGLAHLSPSVASDPALAQAVMAATVIGSNAPDFDTVVRVKGATTYIRYHRGITHSIPALFLWPAVISLSVSAFSGLWAHLMLLYLWAFLAVVLHVFLDMLNTYGVQCLRPFSQRWVHLDILAIFEPFLFVLHAGAAVRWLFFGGEPGTIFSIVYLASFGYIVGRACHHQLLVRRVKDRFGLDGAYHVIPGFHPFYWRFVVETDRHFYTGKVEYQRVRELNVVSLKMGWRKKMWNPPFV